MALVVHNISVVIPTRGDVDITGITNHLRGYAEVDDIVIIEGTTPYNRYIAAADVRHDVIYTQDDDCITDIRQLIYGYDPALIVNAMTQQHATQYPGRQTLIGFGAIFHRSLLSSLNGWVRDALFYRESDRIFATVNDHKTFFPRIDILAHAYADNRLYRQPGHVSARLLMERRIFDATGIVA